MPETNKKDMNQAMQFDAIQIDGFITKNHGIRF